MIGSSAATISFAQERSVDDVRYEALQLCQKGHPASAVHVAMKSWFDVKKKYGKEHPKTAQFLAVVADVAICRGQYYLARYLYRRVLAMEEKALGPRHPEVVRCKKALAHLQQVQDQ